MKLENMLPLFLPFKYHNIVVPSFRTRLLELFRSDPNRQMIYECATDFLTEHLTNKNNYDAIQMELSRYLNWVWANKLDVREVKRPDMVSFINFCNQPPTELINCKAASVLVEEYGELELNPEWRPFKTKQNEPYVRKDSTVKRQLSILSSFYVYLADEDICHRNPAELALRRLNLKKMDNVSIEEKDNKSLSQIQLSYVLRVLDALCEINPARFERSRFLFYLMVMAFPRRSEVSASLTYSPKMSDFERHSVSGGKVRFTFNIRQAKGGKQRKVLCGKQLINALMRYRKFLGLTPLPSDAEKDAPLFIRHRPASHGREAGLVDANLSSNTIAGLIKEIYLLTSYQLIEDGYHDEAKKIVELSAHSTRHTGITAALSAGRKPELLMKDTGHSSIDSLMIYNNDRLDYRLEDVDKLDSKIIEIAKLETTQPVYDLAI